MKTKQPAFQTNNHESSKSTSGVSRPKQKKTVSFERPRRLLRPRNLYLVHETLPSFGLVQLPTRLDVLRRVLYCCLVEKMDQKSAIHKVRLEIVELYSHFEIDVLKTETINQKITDLIVKYIIIIKDVESIKDLDYKAKKEMKDKILDTFRVEYDFAIELGFLFECYDENTVKKFLSKNNVERYLWFVQQLSHKSTGLVISPEKRYADLMKEVK